jgi:hypothetical protein
MSARGRITPTGPLVKVRVRNVPQWQAALEREQSDGGLALPQPVSGWGLVDTGAAITMVRPDVAQGLRACPAPALALKGLHPAKPWETVPAETVPARYLVVEVVGLSGGFTVIAGELPFGDALPGEEIVALLGRDVLAQLRLVYDGPAGMLVLERPA